MDGGEYMERKKCTQKNMYSIDRYVYSIDV